MGRPIPPFGRVFNNMGILGGGGGVVTPPIIYLLDDEYLDTVAPGAVNGTLATDGSLRTAVDTGSKMSVVAADGLTFVTGGAASGNPGVWYPTLGSILGQALFVKIVFTSGGFQVGWDSSATGGTRNGFGVTSTLFAIRATGLASVGVVSAGNTYYIACIQRAGGASLNTGMLYFIKGGAFVNWTLVYVYTTNGETTAALPNISAINTTSVFKARFARVPQDIVAISPLVADTFNATNGALGNTRGIAGDGGETGGSGLPWVDDVGTWAIATNKAGCSATAGGIGIATVDSGKTDVFIGSLISGRTAGAAGLVTRYVDASNYICTYGDGTNVKIDKVIAGIVTNVQTTALATVNSNFDLIANGTAFRLLQSGSLVGAEVTIADAALQVGTKHGLYVTDTSPKFDNFSVWARGNLGEYETSLNPYINP